jgi:hypothetical protein
MFDTTLDLFCYNENLDDRQHMVDTMRDTYWDAMNKGVDDGRELDAIAVFEEWVVDGVDPEDGEYEFTFINDLTRLVEDN